ncbi:hypothetical protein LOTGIDRAFT_156980 [Lottia gigantea]|uniref:Peptidase A2 domain-containing protein n=1 Tax=Lottia gigantea TaxID=225164 RepID=V4BAP8_LOTGI|nr:hypothetical protein LOTGIDRAFT_156980 [Lottia gigantea]ESP03022.1 hypothetical protein LOTGIDRAFT_156980 [Lottia gigantea]
MMQHSRSGKPLKCIDISEQNYEQAEDIFSINLFRVQTNKVQPKLLSSVIINNQLDHVVADTGACVSVCGTSQAKRWNLLDKLVSSKVRIKPYMSNPIAVHGNAICSVTFGSISVPVEWHVISGFCEPILSGDKALQLGIINFSPKAETFFPIHSMDKTADDVSKISLQKILTHYPENFTGLGKLRHHQVKLHFDANVKPVNVPPRPVAYHLKERVHCAIDEMIKQDVIEKHPSNQPAPWISCAVITPKPSERTALSQLLSNYRDTPHPATGIAPSSMLFRDGHQSVFPRMTVSDSQVKEARHRDGLIKHRRAEKINDSKYRYQSLFKIGDRALLRNYNKTSKFHPTFLPDSCKVTHVDDTGSFILLERQKDGRMFTRHPDDIKKCVIDEEIVPKSQPLTEQEVIKRWHELCETRANHGLNDDDSGDSLLEYQQQDDGNIAPPEPRNRRRNPRYFIDDFVNLLNFTSVFFSFL